MAKVTKITKKTKKKTTKKKKVIAKPKYTFNKDDWFNFGFESLTSFLDENEVTSSPGDIANYIFGSIAAVHSTLTIHDRKIADSTVNKVASIMNNESFVKVLDSMYRKSEGQ